MNLRLPIRILPLLLAAATLHAQTELPAKPASTANDVAFPVARPKPKRTPRPEQPLFNLDAIVLDPAHGGPDNGAKITETALEKDVNLAFGNRLKALLAARGFSVLTTRTADLPMPHPDDPNAPQLLRPPVPFNDQRIELANHSRAVACILIHSSNGGHGVHIYTSSLTPPSSLIVDPDQPKPIMPWDTAQASSVAYSLLLANDLSTAFNNIRIPAVLGRASISPIDSITCPAVALELSPLATEDGQTPASDDAYQSRVAEAVVSALVFWRGHAESLAAAQQPKPAAPVVPTPPVVKKPKPKPVTPPIEVPEQSSPAAPIIRKPAATPPPPPPPPPPPGAPTR